MEDIKTFGPESFSFKGINWKKVGMGAIVAMTGALLTYITQWVTSSDFGDYTPLVMAVWSIAANIGRKWVSNLE